MRCPCFRRTHCQRKTGEKKTSRSVDSSDLRPGYGMILTLGHWCEKRRAIGTYVTILCERESSCCDCRKIVRNVFLITLFEARCLSHFALFQLRTMGLNQLVEHQTSLPRQCVCAIDICWWTIWFSFQKNGGTFVWWSPIFCCKVMFCSPHFVPLHLRYFLNLLARKKLPKKSSHKQCNG